MQPVNCNQQTDAIIYSLIMGDDTMKYTERQNAVANFLGVKPSEINKQKDDYLVLTDKEADEKAVEYIKKSLSDFNADFILQQCGLDLSKAGLLKDKGNDFILSLIERTIGIDSFAKSTIPMDGRGQFIPSLDGEEYEVTVGEATYFVYKIN